MPQAIHEAKQTAKSDDPEKNKEKEKYITAIVEAAFRRRYNSKPPDIEEIGFCEETTPLTIEEKDLLLLALQFTPSRILASVLAFKNTVPTLVTRIVRGYKMENEPAKVIASNLSAIATWRNKNAADRLISTHLDNHEKFHKDWPVSPDSDSV